MSIEEQRQAYDRQIHRRSRQAANTRAAGWNAADSVRAMDTSATQRAVYDWELGYEDLIERSATKSVIESAALQSSIESSATVGYFYIWLTFEIINV